MSKDMQRVGDQANKLFEKTDEISTKKSISKPKKLIDKSVKSTVTFCNSQIVWLDNLSTEIRANTTSVVDRGQIIRALIAAVRESKIDLSKATKEREITEIILAKLKKG